jgi:thiol-disulfide isomerase/thioredoxin
MFQKLHIKKIIILFCIIIFFKLPLNAENPTPQKTTELPFDVLPTTKIIYLDVWASWCAPCKASFPFLNKLHQDFSSKGLQVIGYNVDNKKEDATKFLSQIPANFTILYDENKKQFLEKMKLKTMPTSYILDAKGNILSIHQGFTNASSNKIYQEIETLLNKNQ